MVTRAHDTQTRNFVNHPLFPPQGLGELAKDLDVGEPTLKLIVDGLQQPVDYDIRAGRGRTRGTVARTRRPNTIAG